MSTKGDLPVSISDTLSESRINSKPRRGVGRLAVIALLTLAGFSALATHRSLGSRTSRAAPFFAERVLSECDDLERLPGPASDFHERKVSERFEPGTAPTLITNATIWTGGDEGREIIHGGSILLDKGIIKYVGSHPPEDLIASLGATLQSVNARRSWVTPAIVDIHNHAGVGPLPASAMSENGNSLLGIAQPWLRSIDALETHDLLYELTRAGGVGSALILPGSANAIGGQAFMIKTRATKDHSGLSMVLEPPNNILPPGNRSASVPWRHIKHATGENPAGLYHGTRMDTIWKFRESYNEARKVKLAQDAYCAKARAGQWTGLADSVPTDLKWEALVDVIRGKVKVNVHIYESVDFNNIVGLSNEFQFPIAAFHHAHEAYLVPEVIKRAYGPTPAVAIFATFARYKRESYRGSEYAARILTDSGIRVAMKSDAPFPVNSRFLLYEAAQAHYYGLDETSALRSVTTIPADVSGLNHRIGYLRQGWDADVVIWDSMPLTLGATPIQTYIDGIPQLSGLYALSKPAALQVAPKTPDFEKERNATLKWDGLPPLESGKRVRDGRVAFTNVKQLLRKAGSGTIEALFGAKDEGLSSSRTKASTVVFEKGRIICHGSCSELLSSETEIVDLAGGSIAPGFTTYGSELGMADIALDPTTGDGYIHDPVDSSSTNTLVQGLEPKAADGLLFAMRDALLAYRAGVTSGIVAPRSAGLFHGISAAFSTSAKDGLDDGALLKDAVALHVSLVHYGDRSISTQIGLLREGLEGRLGGARGKWFEKVANGTLPLAIEVERADYISVVLALKHEIESSSGVKLRFILLGASEAHLVADHIAEAGVSVILLPARQIPLSWDGARTLAGPPLSPESSFQVLVRAAKESADKSASGEPRMHVGLGVQPILGGWPVRNTRFDVGWVALASNGTISKHEALAFASSEIEAMFGLESSEDLVAYHGGDFAEFEGKAVAVVSPKLEHVDLL